MSSNEQQTYDISIDEILDAGGIKLDVQAIADAHQPWWNRTLSEVSGSWVRLGVMDGDFHWHKHDDTDEFFLVLEGRLDLELEDRTISLGLLQSFTVPRGVMHFPHARGRTVVLMVEKAGVSPIGS